MKNFSVKTADFDSLSISGESPIVQSDLGTAPNQIPLNKDLGTLAYMNAPEIEDINVDTLELREIAAELSETAVDVFVYDTRKDSDGGAWRHRTQHTSWYNEELNTSTRGGRREFPAVAVIVAESDKVTIYDGDDPDLSMWMVFEASPVSNLQNCKLLTWALSGGITSLYCQNGLLSVGISAQTNGGLIAINLFKDFSRYYRDTGSSYTGAIYSGNISTRNTTSYSWVGDYNEFAMVDANVNDVAMTVLPNAPIDSETGLPIPTIAVATDGGVSVIKDDGSVVDISNPYPMQKVSFDESGNLHLARQEANIYYYGAIPSSDVTESDWRAQSDVLYVGNISSGADIQIGDNDIVDIVPGVIGLDDDVDSSLVRLDINKDSLPESMINFTNSHYNTGWMPGDIKLATLSDTKNEKVGVDETTELVTNGTFNTDTSGWNTHLGSSSVVSETARLDANGTTDSNFTTSVTCVVGKTYVLSVDAYRVSGNNSFGIAVSTSSGYDFVANHIAIVGSQTNTSEETKVITFVATATTHYVGLQVNGINSTSVYSIDNVSVKQTGELITNGTFDNGIEGWSENNAVISKSGDKLRVDDSANTGDWSSAVQKINLVAGKRYVVSMNIDYIQVGTTAHIGLHTSNTTTTSTDVSHRVLTGITDSFVSVTFTATSADYLFIGTSGSGIIEFDNISVRLAEDDRSVNDNGLQIFGEITKSPVAPGADLVAYSGFSADNYLMQPYNSDLDFGTGDFCVMGWAKTTSTTANQKIFTRDLNLTNRFQVYIKNGGVSVYTQKDGDFSYTEGSTDVNNGSWFNFFCIRRSGVLEVYVNGKQETAQASGNHETARNLNFGQIASYAGIHIHNSANYFEGSIALLRISATAPTAKQIAKIYRDEKPLFQDGAQATLYGTSDAVTALAYDDSENLLHVGTASGRSVFNGLKRVDNTTTAVSTAISATEGLVIEQ